MFLIKTVLDGPILFQAPYDDVFAYSVEFTGKGALTNQKA